MKTTNMTDADLAALEQLCQQATQHVNDLSAGRKRWRMCVPPQDDDSDVLLTNALSALPALLAEVRALRAELEDKMRRESSPASGDARLHAEKWVCEWWPSTHGGTPWENTAMPHGAIQEMLAQYGTQVRGEMEANRGYWMECTATRTNERDIAQAELARLREGSHAE